MRHATVLALACLAAATAACRQERTNTGKLDAGTSPAVRDSPQVNAGPPVRSPSDGAASPAVRNSYTPSSVAIELARKNVAFQFMPYEEFQGALGALRDWEKKVERNGEEAATPIPEQFLNGFSLYGVRKTLGGEDRVTQEKLPGLLLLRDHKNGVSGKYLWYGRVGLGFVDTDGDPQLTYVFALRFAPKQPAAR
jgi:hypothetical protein